MRPVRQDQLLQGVDRDFIPSPSYYVPVAVKRGDVLLQYTQAMAGRYDGVPKLSNDAALLVNRLGKGTAVYFTGDLGNTIARFHTPELLQLVSNVGREMATAPVAVENAPGSVEMVVRTQNDQQRTLVHLVNFTGEMTRPIRHIIPVSDVRITLGSAIHASKAFTLWDRQSVNLTRSKSGQLQAVIPRLNEYEVLVLEN
jgi:hypothetical protein